MKDLKKPLLIFDGDCHFCRTWILRWKRSTEEKVDYSPYQEEAVHFSEIPMANFQTAVQLVLPSGEMFSGAEAALRALAFSKRYAWLLWLYRHFPGFSSISEFFYRIVARNRPVFSKLTRLAWGDEMGSSDIFISRWLFLRGLGVIYLIAFVSLWTQVQGLFGSDGINPIASNLSRIEGQYGKVFLQLPTVFWFNSSDSALQAACGTGSFISLMAILGFALPFTLLGCWLLYMSFFSIGLPFLSFQWDILLLETGFLAIFLSPLQIKPGFAREAPPSRIVVFLLQLLLFKLILSSGLVKWASNDMSWRNLTALNYHYFTQPLPTWTSYYMQQLPEWFQKSSTFLMFVVELGFPFLIFLPRRLRYAAFFSQVVLQSAIILTGNYTFFNYLTLLLCLLLLDDSFWPKPLQNWALQKRDWSPDFQSMAWPKLITVPLLILVLFLTFVLWPLRFGGRNLFSNSVIKCAISLNSLHCVNNYGLFAVMTTTRGEIIIEGSNDGQTWLPYEFKYKPGDLKRRPAFVAPHQPRLDWQMWFASLGTVQENPWFVNLCVRLLEGSASVTKLLRGNPFPQHPPKYLRAVMYDYTFTTLPEKKETGRWWKRNRPRNYLDPIALR